MNWSVLIGLIIAICIALLFRLRVEPRRARLVNWMFIYPGLVVLFLYAWFFNKWLEVGIAVVVSGLLMAAWWITYGSYLPAATSDNISVWGQEAKKPSVMAAEAQAELEKVKQEKEALEKELERLRKQKDS